MLVLASWVRRRDDWSDRLLALDPTDGHLLWQKDGTNGQHFGHELIGGGERIAYFANTSPNVRVLDARGDLKFGSGMETTAVVSTEVLGTFLEPMFGEPVLAPPFLFVAREKRGLEVYRIE